MVTSETRRTHAGYAGAILQHPSDGTPVLEGSRIAVYFGAPHNGWYEGSVLRTAAVGGNVPVAFDDGPLQQPLSATSYGRYNMWVLLDATRPTERWAAHGHALLGRRCTYEGASGTLRMFCEVRREFSMSICSEVDVAMEAEVIVCEEDAARCAHVARSPANGGTAITIAPGMELDPEELLELSCRVQLLRRDRKSVV